jgi:hypothetical protein
MPEVAADASCLVDPFDPASIRSGLMRVMNDSKYRQSLIAAGFKNVKRFAPHIIAARYAELYRELLN